ncbi:hypothetical protein [Chitinophaga sp. YIM B06452]|uniref:terpene synthase family protein n=1 Tax=Chitinophaga sp. YIM B06452 TaxID=3082158 RepID=UPI0031FEB8DC
MEKKVTDEQFYAGLQHLPRPRYPFPDFIHADFQQQREEYYAWIDKDYDFHSETARKKHKLHNLVDIASRGCPFLNSIEELRPLARYTANGAMMDDYWDRCSPHEMNEVTERITALLTGEDPYEPAGNGIFRQFWVLRRDALQCGMPERLYKKFAAAMHNVLAGYTEERVYYRANIPPPLPIYLVIRQDTSGTLPFCKYVAMQKNYRDLPDSVLEHPFILRLHHLTSWLVGMHNDFISLPKELHRDGDTMNIVKVMQHEHKVSLNEAYMMSMKLHDSYLNEFLLLKENLPHFGALQDTVDNYVEDLGVMVAGIYAWHTNDKTRYVNGGYVEGEFVSRR